MAISSNYFLPPMPQGFEGITELALDLHWSWNHAADRVWCQIAPDLWERTNNPWLILQTVAPERLETLAKDPAFRELLDGILAKHNEMHNRDTWFQTTNPDSVLKVAFFCLEFGLTEALPLYSGGLGILAGDYLKTASDLGVPVTGISLLYQQGYFRQAIDDRGEQLAYYPYNDPVQLPVIPVRKENGEWLQVGIDLPGRPLRLRVWEARVGRIKLYLLDSNDPYNNPADRGITSELYGGGPELRLQQEMVLGIGGWRVLEALEIEPNICHLNEGHAAFTIIERAHAFMKTSDQPFEVALDATRPGNIFTTHTPVEAGFDRFSQDLVSRYMRDYIAEIGISLDRLLALGRRNPADRQEPLNMAYLALRGSGRTNAVSRLHGEVSRRIFQPLFPRWPQREVPVTYVTNGVHMPSWDSAAADNLWTDTCGKDRWLGTLNNLIEDFKKVPDEVLWKFRLEQTRQLVIYARERLCQQLAAMGASEPEVNRCQQLLDPETLTIGFARRFAAYKRPNLLLHDPDRLIRMLNHPKRPVQLIIAGKAHPQDSEGKALVRAWVEFIRRPEVQPHIIFIPDYDMALAAQLVQGVDVWINTPRRPWEACGTSGMKVLVNGGLNLSEKDGWWAEAFRPEIGWAIGDGQEHGNISDWDAQEANQLYSVLENEVIPSFYERDAGGIPRSWVERMRASMAELTPRFSTNRMLREYVEKLYFPALQEYQKRVADRGQKAGQLSRWRESVQKEWAHLHFGQLDIETLPGFYQFKVPVYLGNLSPEAIWVQIYAEPRYGNDEPEIHQCLKGQKLTKAINTYDYSVRIPARRPVGHYTPRIIPFHEDVSVPLEVNQILWYEPGKW